ncbi:MAG: beta-ketoacyl-ACP synthase II [Actinomycetota bacterium]|nr:beta-ketoacyl-ACP synthase II [Actinomycetota bacterium]
MAITGIGAVTPVGIGVDAMWEGLTSGRSGIDRVSAFDPSAHRVQIAGEVGDFEPERWLTTAEVARSDRVAQFALAASALAVEDAAFQAPDPDRVGTVVASGIGGARTVVDNVVADSERGPAAVSPFFVPGAIPNMPAGLVSMRFGYGGPSMCPATACSSSADAVGLGFRLVRDGYADACLAGGTEACVTSVVMAGFAAMFALSKRNDEPQRASRPFDAGRDGFVLSEGAVMLVLEPAEVARARGAHVYAELAGYGQSSDAFHPTAPDPEGRGLVRAMRAALDDAGMAPDEVGYVNAHGTSTKQNDPIETRAVKAVLANGSPPAPISSTKSMTGHLLGAAGGLETAACALAIDRGRLPPTINLDEPDPACDLDYVANEARAARPRAALSNSAGFGGHNVCLALRASAG